MGPVSFDELPSVAKPNPLPCGCAIVGVPGLNRDATMTEYRNKQIRFCPVHEAAPDLLAACKAAESYLANAGLGADVLSRLRAAIAQAEPLAE